ncbi:MAG: carbamoyltransferase, partial [Caldilineaceae bacterium]|nr:carbamoyltransferase [Caldilineaceae bacterium]
MFILGINAYHGGASAAIIRDGELIAAVEEERFTRQKYWAGFPTRSIRYCLDAAGVEAYELDHVGISRNPSAHLVQKALYTLRRRPSFSLLRDRLANAGKVGDLRTQLADALGLEGRNLRAEFHNVEHHRAHMASAFFVSPFQDAAILSVDGMGDFVSTMTGSGRESKMEVSETVHFPHSLGNFYTLICQWLGFPKYGDEGKVMGLAPYGQPRHMDEMAQVLRWHSDGSFELNLDYLTDFADGNLMTWENGTPVVPRLFSDKLVKLLGEPREAGGAITAHHQDVAASLQATLEAVEMALVQRLQQQTGQSRLCMAGGVALNSAFNGKILPNTAFEEIFIQPAAGDAGTSLGVCYYIYHQLLGCPRSFVMTDAYTGPTYANGCIEEAIARANLAARAMDDEALCVSAADLIADQKIVGWYQGAMEWGPRALGNRSILADPRHASTKDLLNARIKRREKFRPFAPAVLAEQTGVYFDQSYPDPFMLKVYQVRPEKHELLPAVTHVDGSGRLQTVEREVNPRYYRLIEAFGERTGV